jgi:plasmid maintenance system killer protein
MEIVCKNNKLAKQLSNASEIKKAFGVDAKRVSTRLEDIRASPNLAVLIQIPQANCHPLKGDRNGDWALDISANRRLIFEIVEDPVPKKEDGSINTILIKDILLSGIVDYH